MAEDHACGGYLRVEAIPARSPTRSEQVQLSRLDPERIRLAAVLTCGVASVRFLVAGPKLPGNATNVLSDGIVGRQFPADVTKAQAVAQLRARGEGQFASMLSGMNVTPGAGVDITRLGQILGSQRWCTCPARPSTSARASSSPAAISPSRTAPASPGYRTC